MDIAQWEQRLNNALDMFFDVFDELHAQADITPEVEISTFERAIARYQVRLEKRRAQRSKALVAANDPVPRTRTEWTPTVGMISEVGDQTWVQPLAIVEHTGTGDYFIDPRFGIADMPSDVFTIEVVVTEDGLVASGPADQHRLREHVERSHFRPLAAFKVATG